MLISGLERRALLDLRSVTAHLPVRLRAPVDRLHEALDAEHEALTREEVLAGLDALRWRLAPLFGAEVDAVDRILRHCGPRRALPERGDPEGLAELCDLAYVGLSLAFQEYVVFGGAVDEVPRWTRLEERLREACDRAAPKAHP